MNTLLSVKLYALLLYNIYQELRLCHYTEQKEYILNIRIVST